MVVIVSEKKLGYAFSLDIAMGLEAWNVGNHSVGQQLKALKVLLIVFDISHIFF